LGGEKGGGRWKRKNGSFLFLRKKGKEREKGHTKDTKKNKKRFPLPDEGGGREPGERRRCNLVPAEEKKRGKENDPAKK